MAEEQRIEEANLEVAGQKIHLKSVALNTLLTLMCVLGVGYTALIVTQHAAQAATREDTFAKLMAEMVQAQREQNCLISIPEAQREGKAEFCKRVTR